MPFETETGEPVDKITAMGIIEAQQGGELLDSMRKGKTQPRVPVNRDVWAEVLVMLDVVTRQAMTALANDEEFAREIGFDQVLAGDLRYIPARARLERLSYDLRAAYARLGRVNVVMPPLEDAQSSPATGDEAARR